jgi:hypothetical protein
MFYKKCKSLNRNLSFNRKNRKIEILLIVVQATIRTVMLDKIHLKPPNSQLSWIMVEAQQKILNHGYGKDAGYLQGHKSEIFNFTRHYKTYFQLHQMSEDSI